MTIPKQLRVRFALEPHEEVVFLESRRELILRKKQTPGAESRLRKWIGHLSSMSESVDTNSSKMFEDHDDRSRYLKGSQRRRPGSRARTARRSARSRFPPARPHPPPGEAAGRPRHPRLRRVQPLAGHPKAHLHLLAQVERAQVLGHEKDGGSASAPRRW